MILLQNSSANDCSLGSLPESRASNKGLHAGGRETGKEESQDKDEFSRCTAMDNQCSILSPILRSLREGTRELATLAHLFISFHPHWLKPTGLGPLHFQVVHVWVPSKAPWQPTLRHQGKSGQKIPVGGVCQKWGAIRLYLHKLGKACAGLIAAAIVKIKDRIYFLSFIPTLFQ